MVLRFQDAENSLHVTKYELATQQPFKGEFWETQAVQLTTERL
jgi:hypothetical protein